MRFYRIRPISGSDFEQRVVAAAAIGSRYTKLTGKISFSNGGSWQRLTTTYHTVEHSHPGHTTNTLVGMRIPWLFACLAWCSVRHNRRTSTIERSFLSTPLARFDQVQVARASSESEFKRGHSPVRSQLTAWKETTLAIRANVIPSTQDTLFYCKCTSRLGTPAPNKR